MAGKGRSWVEVAGIWDWIRLGIHCLLPEEGTAWEEGLDIGRCLGRQCSTSRLLHPFFAPFLPAKGEAQRCKVGSFISREEIRVAFRFGS